MLNNCPSWFAETGLNCFHDKPSFVVYYIVVVVVVVVFRSLSVCLSPKDKK